MAWDADSCSLYYVAAVTMQTRSKEVSCKDKVLTRPASVLTRPASKFYQQGLNFVLTLQL